MSDASESSGDLLKRLGTDAQKWTEEFGKQIEGLDGPLDLEPGGLVHGWFANAIEAGRSAGKVDSTPVVETSPFVEDIPFKSLEAYSQGDLVYVYVAGDWVSGSVFDPSNGRGLVIVDTDRGSRTIASMRSIRPRG